VSCVQLEIWSGVSNAQLSSQNPLTFSSRWCSIRWRLLGRRPCIIKIDDKSCYKRVKYLLKDVEGNDVEYYPPPTEEELNAVNIMEKAGKDPFS